MATLATYWIVAGIVVRRDVRRALQAGGYDFTEDKGWLDSQFTVHDTPQRIEALAQWARQWLKNAE